MKVIYGRYKGKIIPAVQDMSYRPSTGKLKESLFSILSSDKYGSFSDFSSVLDLFSGTGSLGIEALSRGVQHVTFVDANRTYLYNIDRFLSNLPDQLDYEIICSKLPANFSSKRKYDLIFIDPPYKHDLVTPTLSMLHTQQYMNDGCLLCIETEKNFSFVTTEYMNIIDERNIGIAKLTLLMYRNYSQSSCIVN